MTIAERRSVEKLTGEDLDLAVWQELGFRTADDDHIYPPHPLSYGRAICPIEEWSPSTNLQHAWEAVVVLNQRGWFLSLSQPYPSDGDLGVTACFHRDPAVTHEYMSQIADTAPLAICRAALRVARR